MYQWNHLGQETAVKIFSAIGDIHPHKMLRQEVRHIMIFFSIYDMINLKQYMYTLSKYGGFKLLQFKENLLKCLFFYFEADFYELKVQVSKIAN